MSVTPQFILQGAYYALEQCGALLRDANVLYRSKSYASAVVLAAFAREEMGRSYILLGLWRKAAAGEAFTIEQLNQACDDHVAKQQAGMLSHTMRADTRSGLGRLLAARSKNKPESAEWKKADAELNEIDDKKAKRIPNDRHEKRIKALYVEPISETAWNRPSVTTATTAYEFLVDAVNEYRVRIDRYVASADAILKKDDPDLYNALQQWSARPVLPSTEAPQFPMNEDSVEKATGAYGRSATKNCWHDLAHLTFYAAAAAAAFTFWLAWRTGDLARNSGEDLIAANRAWLGVSHAEFLRTPDAPDGPLIMIYFRNVGRFPALDIRTGGTWLVIPTNPIQHAEAIPESPAWPVIDKQIREQCSSVKPLVGGASVFPLSNSDGKYQLSAPEQIPDMQPVTKGRTQIVVAPGCITYKTVDEVHHTAFCYYGTNFGTASKWEFESCPVGNFAE